MADDVDEPQAQGDGAGPVKSSGAEDSREQGLTRACRLKQQQEREQHRPKNLNAPSGIARLRESGERQPSPNSDAMNIDDLIMPTSIATPSFSPSPPPPASNATASAIPIHARKDNQEAQHASFLPSAPQHNRPRNGEFDYVQRRLRKTSIDETRVRHAAGLVLTLEVLTQ